jgi:uncharacterized protein YbaR (Trm112 family)
MTQPLPDSILQALVDPLSREPLRPATQAELRAIEGALASGRARTRGGSPAPARIEGAFVTAGGDAAYLVVEGLPHFIVDERIELDVPLGQP